LEKEKTKLEQELQVRQWKLTIYQGAGKAAISDIAQDLPGQSLRLCARCANRLIDAKKLRSK
jgi:hypothetical protein